MERVRDRGGAEQSVDLLLALAHLQLTDGLLPDQVALIDGLLIDDAAARGGQGNGGDQQEIAHRGMAFGEIESMIHS